MLVSDPLLVIGIALCAGFLGQRLFKRLGIPQVVGGIVVGLFLGVSMGPYALIDREMLDAFEPLIVLALCFIGFNIGGELKFDVLKSLGKTVVSILLAEALGAFLLVTLVSYVILHDHLLALVFGALASATAPAATTDVLAEYKAKGPLTITLLAIVGMDDVVGLILYGFVSGLVEAHLTHAALSIATVLVGPGTVILSSLGVGAIVGWGMTRVLSRANSRVEILVPLVGGIVLIAGISEAFNLSEILASMAGGIMLANLLSSRRGEMAFDTLSDFTPPFFVLFFVLVGARLRVETLLIPSVAVLAGAYIAARSFGKIGGSWLGAKVSHAPDTVRRYLGLCLFSQAGVAVGLAFAFYRKFSEYGGPEAASMGHLVITVIAATTLVVQLIGPPFVKYAITRAGEVGKASKYAEDVMIESGRSC